MMKRDAIHNHDEAMMKRDAIHNQALLAFTHTLKKLMMFHRSKTKTWFLISATRMILGSKPVHLKHLDLQIITGSLIFLCAFVLFVVFFGFVLYLMFWKLIF